MKGRVFFLRNVISNFLSVLKVSNTHQTVWCRKFYSYCFFPSTYLLEITVLSRLTIFTRGLYVDTSRWNVFLYENQQSLRAPEKCYAKKWRATFQECCCRLPQNLLKPSRSLHYISRKNISYSLWINNTSQSREAQILGYNRAEDNLLYNVKHAQWFISRLDLVGVKITGSTLNL